MDNCYNENYLCDRCDKEFNKISKFLSHSIHEHGITEDEISYDCANCYQSFSILSNFQQHIVKKTSTMTFEIKPSEIQFPKTKLVPKNEFHVQDPFESSVKVFLDENIEENEEKINMLEDPLAVTQKLSVRESQKNKKSNVQEDQNKECCWCRKSFPTEEDLNRHLHDIHKSYKCYLCDNKVGFYYLTTLKKHLHSVHDTDKNDKNKAHNIPKCSKCGKEFCLTNDLTRHILCDHCGKTNIHEGKNQDHKCNKCGKLFPMQNDLKRHIIICDFHHKCRECGKLFSIENNLKKHILNAHKETSVHESKNDLNYMSYKCILCNKIFDDKIALKSHMSNFHEGRYACDICNYCFKSPVLLNVHVSKIHKRIKNEPI